MEQKKHFSFWKKLRKRVGRNEENGTISFCLLWSGSVYKVWNDFSMLSLQTFPLLILLEHLCLIMLVITIFLKKKKKKSILVL